ncbi:Uncharacterised protein [uncultured Clostridium sp.]|nr:hypothetical protein [uncultured Clostridium sp.]SCJ52328.1 Uncharacterised protein [uncultured Clostridium sp.]
MKVNLGIRDDNKKILFITDDQENNIGELEISDEAYNIMLKELSN